MDLPDGCRDALDLVAVTLLPDQPRVAGHRLAIAAWDAWAYVRPDALGDAYPSALPRDAVSGKSADPAQDDRARDAAPLPTA
jgi:hypothetical protein